MKYDFEHPIDRSQTISIKWSKELRKQMFGDSDIIPMGIADMDFRVSPAIARAVQKRAQHDTYGYGFPSDEYLEACVNWQRPKTKESLEYRKRLDCFYARRQYGFGMCH